MSKLARNVKPQRLVKFLKKLGFDESRTTGSHMIYKNKEKTKRVVIPYHAGKTIHPKIVKDILKTVNITLEEFIKFL